MANARPNPFGMATPLGEGLAKTFEAFLSAPTPEDRAANALKIYGMQAAGKRDLADADKIAAEKAGIDIRNRALQALPTLNFDAPTAQGTVMQTMDGNYASLAEPFLVHMARQPGATPQQLDPLAYAKTGNAPNTFAGLAVTDATDRRGQDVTAATARRGQDLTYKSNIYDTDRDYQASTENNRADNLRALVQTKLQEAGLDRRNAANLANSITIKMLDNQGAMERSIADNARAIQIENIQQAGNDRRFNVETSPGAITTLAPGNPLGVTKVVGLPTTDTQKGQIIAEERAKSGFDPVNTQYDAQSAVGGALGVPNEGSGMSLTVGPDGTVQMTQGGAGVSLPTSTISNNLQAQESIESYLRTSKELRDVASADPLLFGTPGNVRRFLQSAATQADLLLQMAGKSAPGAAKDVDTVFETVLTDLSMNGVNDPAMYDPNLTDIDKLAILAAYQAAAAIAGQEGRGLSNEDFIKFRTIVGDPTAWGATQQSFLAGLNRLDRLAMAELNARRRRLGMDPVDPNAVQSQGAASQAEKVINGRRYRKVNGQWYEVTQ